MTNFVDIAGAARVLAVASLVCSVAQAQTPQPPSFAKATDDGQWTMPAKDAASTRYSSLDEINAQNVKNLKVAFAFSTGLDRGEEAAPLVVGDTMFFALDLKQGGALKWRYDPLPSAASQGVACCDVVNRGAVFADGKLIYNTLDDYTIAVAADTGKEVWRTKMGEINKGETMTMAPLLAKDKVLVGDSGGELGVRGWAAALDVKTRL